MLSELLSTDTPNLATLILVVLALSFSHVLICNLYIAGIRFEVVMEISVLDLPFYVQSSCILEFDGASKGNPGQAGAGAILRAADGSMVLFLACQP